MMQKSYCSLVLPAFQIKEGQSLDLELHVLLFFLSLEIFFLVYGWSNIYILYYWNLS